MTSALQLCRTTILLLMQTVSSEPLLARLSRAVDAIEIKPECESTPETVLKALEFARICVNDQMLAGEIRRAIGALEDEMKGVGV